MAGIFTFGAIALVALAILGMGIAPFFQNVGEGIEIVAENPTVQEQAQKVKDYVINNGTEIGKELLNQLLEGVN